MPSPKLVPKSEIPGLVRQCLFSPVRMARWVSSKVIGLVFLLEPGDSVCSESVHQDCLFNFLKQLCNYSSGCEVLSSWDFKSHLLSD